jgi:tRNA A37 threonylcarbamoyladenosine synthetase subunit TsaC/SUA5/YrdC
VAAMVDAGDLQKSAPSTVIQVNDDMLKLVRPGAIEAGDIRSVLAA